MKKDKCYCHIENGSSAYVMEFECPKHMKEFYKSIKKGNVI